MIMGDLTFLVWNCDGLNAPHKRTSVLTLLRRKKIDLALLQETHLLEQDLKRIANKFYHIIASSSYHTMTRGVAVVVRRSLPIKMLDIWTDKEGRLVIAKIELYGRKIALTLVYAPNKYDKCFYDHLMQKMLELNGYYIVVGADMNAVLDTQLDRSHPNASGDQMQATAALQGLVTDLSLIDIWRSVNHTLRDYSFFSHRHKTSSRIDFLFSSPQLFETVNSAMLLPIALSDHKGVLCHTTLSCITKRATRWRFNSSLLRNEEYITQFITELDKFLSFNIGSVQDPRILWDAVKGFIRSDSIRFSSSLHKEKSAKLQTLEAELSRLSSILQNNYSEHVETQYCITKKEINNILKQLD